MPAALLTRPAGALHHDARAVVLLCIGSAGQGGLVRGSRSSGTELVMQAAQRPAVPPHQLSHPMAASSQLQWPQPPTNLANINRERSEAASSGGGGGLLGLRDGAWPERRPCDPGRLGACCPPRQLPAGAATAGWQRHRLHSGPVAALGVRCSRGSAAGGAQVRGRGFGGQSPRLQADRSTVWASLCRFGARSQQ